MFKEQQNLKTKIVSIINPTANHCYRHQPAHIIPCKRSESVPLQLSEINHQCLPAPPANRPEKAGPSKSELVNPFHQTNCLSLEQALRDVCSSPKISEKRHSYLPGNTTIVSKLPPILGIACPTTAHKPKRVFFFSKRESRIKKKKTHQKIYRTASPRSPSVEALSCNLLSFR